MIALWFSVGCDGRRERGNNLDNYEGTLESDRPKAAETRRTQTVAQHTAAIPSGVYLGVAVAAVGLSLALQLGGRRSWGNFIAQWVPAWLIFGVYNKLVKLEGHDHIDNRGYTS